MTKVLLDTDIGSDIDDALCLAYLLAHRECELLGITTVSGDVVTRAKLADAICKLVGRTVPIYPGLSNPILIPCRQPLAQQGSVLSRWPHRTDFPAQHETIAFMSRVIRENPGQVTLLGIGPMTNIAALFLADPEIPTLLHQLVLMAGNVKPTRWGTLGLVEWNIWNDPHAAAIVFNAPVPRGRLIGLDTTIQLVIDPHAAREQFRGGIFEIIREMTEVWFTVNKHAVYFHDPLAAVTIFNQSICEFDRGQITVQLPPSPVEGLMIFKPDPKSHWEAAITVKPSAFFEHYFSVTNQPAQ